MHAICVWTLSIASVGAPARNPTSYADLVAWSQDAGVVMEHTAQRLLKEATRRPAGAAAALERAIALREAIYRIFSAVAGGRTPEPTEPMY